VVADNNFQYEKVSENLRKAMKGLGTDEDAIIAELTKINNAQRQQLAAAYEQMYGRDLTDRLKSELSGKLKKVVVALMTPAEAYDASELRSAMKGLGTDEDALIEILTSRSNLEIRSIKLAYKKQYGRDLERDLKGDTSGAFKNILLSLANAYRDETTTTNQERAKVSARALTQAGTNRLGTDDWFNRILCTLSHKQLRLVFEEYKALNGKEIEDVIKEQMYGDLRDGMLAIVQRSKCKFGYFVSRLHEGLREDHSTVIRVIVSRSEIDLGTIKEHYEKIHGKSLASAVRDACQGDYRKILLELIKDPYPRVPEGM